MFKCTFERLKQVYVLFHSMQNNQRRASTQDSKCLNKLIPPSSKAKPKPHLVKSDG